MDAAAAAAARHTNTHHAANQRQRRMRSSKAYWHWESKVKCGKAFVLVYYYPLFYTHQLVVSRPMAERHAHQLVGFFGALRHGGGVAQRCVLVARLLWYRVRYEPLSSLIVYAYVECLFFFFPKKKSQTKGFLLLLINRLFTATNRDDLMARPHTCCPSGSRKLVQCTSHGVFSTMWSRRVVARCQGSGWISCMS